MSDPGRIDQLAGEENSEPQIIDAGRLTGMKWPGSVSYENLIQKGLTTEEQINLAIEKINSYYVSSNPGAKTRCIDGRHDPELDEKQLGPQVPGRSAGCCSCLASRSRQGRSNARYFCG